MANQLTQYLKTATQPKYRRLMAAFGLFIYFYLEAELLFTNNIGEKMGESAGTMFYGFFCLAAAIGFFSFAFLCRLIPAASMRRLIFILGGIGVVSTLAASFTDGQLLPAFTLLAMLMVGIVGACLLFIVAVNVKEKSIMGLFIALPYVFAFILQYILGFIVPLFGGSQILIQHIILAAALFAAFVLTPKRAEDSARRHEASAGKEAEKKGATKKYLVGALAALILIACLYGLVDGIIMTLHTGQQLNVYGWVRLLCVPGLLLAGWTMDFREGRYFPFATVAAFVALIIALFLFNEAETFNAALGSVYFLCSFMTMYSLGIFVRVADQSGKAAFWASAGRGIKYLMGGIFVLLGAFVFSNFSLIAFSVIYLILLVLLFIILYFQGKLNPAGIVLKETEPATDMPLSESIKEYGFTNRETEVLNYMLKGWTTAAIAERMNIREHTVQKYVSSMMAKSFSSSRAILVTKFSARNN